MPTPDPLGQVLLALTAVVVVGRLLGRVFRAIGQPAVIGEVVGGIALGPSLLGQIAPDLSQYILPLTVAPFLGVIAQLGVIIYMFLVGVELNPGLLRGQVRAVVAIAHASIAVPFAMGAALAWYLYPRFAGSEVPFTSFALFVGIAMSITAFPVLARILSERGMTTTRLGAAYLGDSRKLLAQLPANSVNVTFTSPPFALHFKKEYGNVEKSQYIPWFLAFARDVHRALRDDGSFADMRRLIAKGCKAKQRPSGHNITEKWGKDQGGAICSNLLQFVLATLPLLAPDIQGETARES